MLPTNVASRRADPVGLRISHWDPDSGDVWWNVVNLRPGTREYFLEHLSRDWPGELERYERLYARGAYLRKESSEPVRARVAELRREHGIADRRPIRLKRKGRPT